MERGVPEVGRGEPGPPELLLRHHGHRSGRTGEGGERLELAGGDPPPRVVAGATPESPSQHVEDLAIGCQAVPEDAVVGGGAPGGDRGERGGGRGRHHRGDRAADALPARQRGREMRPGAELLPAEAVEDQEHHLAGAARRRRQPVAVGAGMSDPSRAGAGRGWRCSRPSRPAGGARSQWHPRRWASGPRL